MIGSLDLPRSGAEGAEGVEELIEAFIGRPQIRARCEQELYDWWKQQPDKEEIVRQAVSEERERRLNS